MGPTLAAAGRGDEFEIRAVPDDEVRAKLLRLGFLDGPVTCRRRLRDGPVVLARNGTELALGAGLASEIEIG